jgi:thiamine-monophosphate kinase
MAARRVPTVGSLGEFGLIDQIARLARGLPARDVVLGIGDDAALLRVRAGEDVVVSTDARVAGVHFRFDQESPAGIGRRAFAAAVSDLAAMGARPLGVLLSVATPPALSRAALLGIVRGLVAGARAARCPLVGGNVTRGSELSLTLSVVGAVPRGRALRRDRARPGDRVFVTGTLGRTALERALGRVRWTPPLRLAVGRRLTTLRGIGACIDLSDGLRADLEHVCRASGVSATIAVGAVPRPPRFATACARAGLDPAQALLAGGEDYELLFTLRPGRGVVRGLGAPVREIGVIGPRGRGPLVRVADAPRAGRSARGWRHF